MIYYLFPQLCEFAARICEFWWQLSQAMDNIMPGLGDLVFGIYEWLHC